MTSTSSSTPRHAAGSEPFTPQSATAPHPVQHPTPHSTSQVHRPSAGAPPEASLGQLVSDASTHMSTLVRSEIELATLELRSTVKNAGTGIGLFAAAATILVFSLVFGFLTLAEGLNALGLTRWLAFLIVFVFQLLLVGLFAFLGFKKVKKVKAPERTIRTTKETVGYLKSHPK